MQHLKCGSVSTRQTCFSATTDWGSFCSLHCRHTTADANSGTQRPRAPTAALRLWLSSAPCRIQSASTSAGLWLQHVKTPTALSLHCRLERHHPSIFLPESFTRYHTQCLPPPPARGRGKKGQDKPFFFLLIFFFKSPSPLFRLSWRTQFYYFQFVVREYYFTTNFDFSNIPSWVG